MTTSDPSACTNCGLCNTVDPIQSVVRKESASTRFKVVLAKSGKPSPLFYLTSDTGLQEAICPAGIRIGDVFRQARERNITSGLSTGANDEMVANFKRNSTPYKDFSPEEPFDKLIW